jgi:hypothetical protein
MTESASVSFCASEQKKLAQFSKERKKSVTREIEEIAS